MYKIRPGEEVVVTFLQIFCLESQKSIFARHLAVGVWYASGCVVLIRKNNQNLDREHEKLFVWPLRQWPGCL